MDSADIAQRFARQRPGFDLVAYREVALPVFRITLELLVLDKKPVPPIQEFVLRAVEAGLGDLASVAGMLGLQEEVARQAVGELLMTDDLVLKAADPENGRHVLALTKKGIETTRELSSVQAVEAELHVFVDGLTRRTISATGRGMTIFPTREAPSRGLVEIPSHPRRPPRFEEIRFEEVREVIQAESAGRRAAREVIGITGMGKVRRHAREAVALAYRSQRDDELLVSLVVDGAPSEAHDAAFGRAQRHAARPLVKSDWHSASDLLDPAIATDLLAQAPSEEETSRLVAARAEARRERQGLRRETERGTSDELEAVRQRLEAAERRERELADALAAISVRQVQVFEHPEYLERALTEAKERVLIISPWITAAVVDQTLLSRLRKLLDRKVSLYIGYGISAEGGRQRGGKKGEADREAERALQRLAQQYSNFHLARLGNTHAKVLACDSRFAVVTSFNWLSFRGDTQLDFRDERGMYVGIPLKVDEVWADYIERLSPHATARPS